jgi:hypothetical protein
MDATSPFVNSVPLKLVFMLIFVLPTFLCILGGYTSMLILAVNCLVSYLHFDSNLIDVSPLSLPYSPREVVRVSCRLLFWLMKLPLAVL